MIYYTISKHHELYYIWKNVETKNSYGFISIFSSPTKRECIDYCKINHIDLRGGLQWINIIKNEQLTDIV